MKKLVLIAACLLLFITTTVGCSQPSAPAGDQSAAENNYPTPENPVTLQWGLVSAPDSISFNSCSEIANAIKEKTKGAIKIDLYPSGQLGNEDALLDGILSGTIDMGNISTTTISNMIPDFNMFSIPYIFPNVETFYAVMTDAEVQERVSSMTDKYGAIYLGINSSILRGLCSKVPIHAPEDLKGLKMRCQPSKALTDMFSAWGSGTVILPFGEVYTALQQGVVDGLCVDVGGAVDMNFFEQAKYYTDTDHTLQFSPTLISNTLWNSFSPEQHQLIYEAFASAASGGIESFYEERNSATDRALNEFKVTMITLTPEEKKAFVDKVAHMKNDYENINQDFMDWFVSTVEEKTIESRQ